jgi:hypothetical protein
MVPASTRLIEIEGNGTGEEPGYRRLGSSFAAWLDGRF